MREKGGKSHKFYSKYTLSIQAYFLMFYSSEGECGTVINKIGLFILFHSFQYKISTLKVYAAITCKLVVRVILLSTMEQGKTIICSRF